MPVVRNITVDQLSAPRFFSLYICGDTEPPGTEGAVLTYYSGRERQYPERPRSMTRSADKPLPNSIQMAKR